MSDIYLQITETPTVVTLSAPVISGALTSTVTVANVVTVALDSNSLSALENVTVTVGAAITGTVTVSNFPASQAVTFSAVSISNLPSTQTIAGTVTVGTLPSIANNTDFVLVGENLAEGFNNYGVFGVSVSNLYTATQTIAGSVTLGASTAQIGSVTASISNSVTIASLPPISGTVTVGNSVTIASLPAISGTVTANTFALQGTAVTTSNFTSTTASTVLASFNATREVLTIFNEGAGNLHICAGATCTTIAYQVRLSAGDYYEVPNHQTTITHSAVFATAGTARIVQIS